MTHTQELLATELEYLQWAGKLIADLTATNAELLEACEEALIFVEALGYVGGDIHDFLSHAIEKARGT